MTAGQVTFAVTLAHDQGGDVIPVSGAQDIERPRQCCRNVGSSPEDIQVVGYGYPLPRALKL